MSNVEKIIEEMELLIKQLKTELEIGVSKAVETPVDVNIQDNEELMFSISCLDDEKKCETGDKIYYIKEFIDDPESSEGGCIYVINTDGTGGHRLMTDSEVNKHGSQWAYEIYEVDDKWVYYVTDSGESRKITIRGTMDQEV